MADPLGTDVPLLGPFDLPTMPNNFFTRLTPSWSRAFTDRLAIVLDGTPVSITPAEGWADYGGDYPIYGRRVPGRLIRLSGLLKRTGATFTTTASLQPIATVSPLPTWAVTGVVMTSGGLARATLSRDGTLNLLTLPGGTAVSITSAGPGFVVLDSVAGRV
jgi:hypothetical protein